jgi:cyanate permease
MSMPSSEGAAKPQQPSFWVAVICGAVILTIGIGARQSFGIFQKPIAADLNVGRELWSFANALALLLMGAFSPFAGNVADRFGTARTVIIGQWIPGSRLSARPGMTDWAVPLTRPPAIKERSLHHRGDVGCRRA